MVRYIGEVQRVVKKKVCEAGQRVLVCTGFTNNICAWFCVVCSSI